MRIGFLLPSQFSIGNPGNGIAEQARNLAKALEQRGHLVVRLNPWQHYPSSELDVLHFFLGGTQLYGIEGEPQPTKSRILVFSPIIDSNQSNRLYRLAASAGNILPRLLTIPGVLQQQALGSRVVVCRSEHERERVVRGLGIPKNRTEVVLNGIESMLSESHGTQEVKKSLGLPDHFVLHVSAYTQERKNVLRLVEATEQLGYPIVIAGHATPGAILNTLQMKARGNDKIRLLGFIDKQTRNALYRLCRIFCLPSYHEGTGLAALEAGASGANLVITKNGGTADYFQSYAIYVDPFDVAAIRSAIEQAWKRPKDDGLRDHIANNLTWDQSAHALELVYRKYLTQTMS
jgi:glycosyltransferase involved in cell wall biosynthesis